MRRQIMVVLSVSSAILTGFFVGGCLTWKLVTFQWCNESRQKIWVDEVKGFHQSVAAGWVLPGDKPGDKTGNYGGPIRVENSIAIRWKSGNEEHNQALSREEAGLPKTLNGDTVRFTYQADGRWRIEQVR